MQENGIYRVLLDERWDLEDLYEFPHYYSQTYSLIYCFDSELDPRSNERIDFALNNYPWKGGYSYVNIYTVLRNQIPKEHRPQISSIQYASPGWLDLLLNPDVALQVAKSVGILLGTAYAAAKTCKKIHKIMASINKERKKNDIKIASLTQTEAATMMKLSDDLAKHLGFGSVEKLHERTKNPEISLKILMAHYRRLDALSDFVKSGKAKLPYIK